jgi:hypothetical protein
MDEIFFTKRCQQTPVNTHLFGVASLPISNWTTCIPDARLSSLKTIVAHVEKFLKSQPSSTSTVMLFFYIIMLCDTFRTVLLFSVVLLVFPGVSTRDFTTVHNLIIANGHDRFCIDLWNKTKSWMPEDRWNVFQAVCLFRCFRRARCILKLLTTSSLEWHIKLLLPSGSGEMVSDILKKKWSAGIVFFASKLPPYCCEQLLLFLLTADVVSLSLVWRFG